ncbi:MAG TPA: RidA family protein [Casimicrobiaceae bacterium]|nr:RidA family protein [Casimicrobiaceae bacterium]
MSKRFHNPEPFKSENRPYSMAVKAGRLVFLAGQLGVEFVDGKRTVVAPGNAGRQIETIFLNMRTMLEDVGASLRDVCWLQIFVTNIDDRLAMDPVRRRFFGEDELPAATMVEVSRLALPGAVVEVNAIAVIADKLKRG